MSAMPVPFAKASGRAMKVRAPKTAEYGSTDLQIAAGRYVLGGIDLDPASSPRWNARVGALRFYTKRDDALRLPAWDAGPGGMAFLNAPGDPRGELVPRFWQRLQVEQLAGRVTAAMWVGFSLEQLRTCQDVAPLHPLDLPTLIFAKREAYYELVRGRPMLTEAPSQASYLTLLPPLEAGARRAMVARFAAYLQGHGKLIGV